jgi:hypothetical protein
MVTARAICDRFVQKSVHPQHHQKRPDSLSGQGVRDAERAGRQIKNSFGLRACVLHHFHQHLSSLSRIAYLPQECNASTAYAIRGPQ